MIDKQPEALLYADILANKIPSIECLEKAAAELRRLHEVNAELVEALKMAKDFIGNMPIETKFDGWKQTLVTDMQPIQRLFSTIVAALAKAEGK